MSSLRIRVVLIVTLAALVPVVAVSLFARTTIVQRTEEQHARRLDLAVSAAGRRVDERAESDARAVTRLCERDFVIDRLMLDLGNDRFSASRQDELVRLMPRLMESLDLDTLEVLDARNASFGVVLGSAHFPGRAGAADPELVRHVRTSEGPFVRDVRVWSEGGARDERALLIGCQADRGGVSLVVVGGRFLDDRFADDLAADVDAVRIVLTDGEGRLPARAEAGGGRRDVRTFTTASGDPGAQLVAVVDDSELTEQLIELDQGFLVGGGVAVVISLIFGLLLAISLSRPLGELEVAADRVAAGDLQSTIGVRSGGEVGRVLHAFNRMTKDLRHTREKLLRAERIAAWRDIARRIAHEIKNPLSPIQVSIETMRKTYKKKHPDFDEIFEESTLLILEEVERLRRIVTEFSEFARMPRPNAEDLDVREVVGHVVGLHSGGEVPVEVVEEGQLPIIKADREQLTQVLVNLVQNAADAARSEHPRGGGQVRVTTAPNLDGGVMIRIEDNGPGIPDEQRTRIFEPYFTTKAGGTGLGLAIVHRIVSDHMGSVDVDEASLGGAEFLIQLTREGPPKEASASMTDAALPLVTRR